MSFEKLTVGSLFAGIGGIELGLERTGWFKTAWQVEIDVYATTVLSKRWPNARRWGDVQTFPPEPTQNWKVDVIAGGFPCQDISIAGSGRGLAGSKSGLWSEMSRIIGIIRPSYAIIENVEELLVNGLRIVLNSLANNGYDAEWACLPASRFGAVHRRKRLFIIAYPAGIGCTSGRDIVGVAEDDTRLERFPASYSCKDGWDVQRWIGQAYNRFGFSPSDTATRRRADGIPDRLDRIRCLGNAVVPRVAEWIGRRIISLERGAVSANSEKCDLPLFNFES